MDGCGRGAEGGGGRGGVGREWATFEPLTSKFQKTEPNPLFSGGGAQRFTGTTAGSLQARVKKTRLIPFSSQR